MTNMLIYLVMNKIKLFKCPLQILIDNVMSILEKIVQTDVVINAVLLLKSMNE